MADYQLDLIRRYCDTTRIHLNRYEKDILCMVLENPAKYDGFTSKVYVTESSGKDYRGRWDSVHKAQYRIMIDSNLYILVRSYHACDGYVQDEYWDWDNAGCVTDTRRIISILQEIQHEL